MNKKIITLLVLIGGIGIAVLFFPTRDQLPYHGSVKSFTIESAFGGTYDFSNKRNKLVVFFFTNCPDICPMTIANMKELQGRLEEDGLFNNRLDIVAISLDPEEDTPLKIKEYAKHFDADQKGWHWLRTTTAETKEIANRFSMLYDKSTDGTLSHSTTMYLVDDKEEIRGLYSMATPKQSADIDQISRDVNKLK